MLQWIWFSIRKRQETLEKSPQDTLKYLAI